MGKDDMTREEWMAIAACVDAGNVIHPKPLADLVREMKLLAEEDTVPRLKCSFTRAGSFLMRNFNPKWELE